MRPNWDVYRSKSRIQKTKFRFKWIQRDVRWHDIKHNAQSTWVSRIGCSIRNAKAADIVSHARLAIYTVGRGKWKPQPGG
jgi:hypothetical protein